VGPDRSFGGTEINFVVLDRVEYEGVAEGFGAISLSTLSKIDHDQNLIPF
jgi:hypothetical protein